MKSPEAHKNLSADELDYLSWIGGRFESLTFRIFGSDHLPEQEQEVALIADVYNYNGESLEEAVGKVDEIYVVAEINGKPYLTKGAVFCYYEFNSDTPMDDGLIPVELVEVPAKYGIVEQIAVACKYFISEE